MTLVVFIPSWFTSLLGRGFNVQRHDFSVILHSVHYYFGRHSMFRTAKIIWCMNHALAEKVSQPPLPQRCLDKTNDRQNPELSYFGNRYLEKQVEMLKWSCLHAAERDIAMLYKEVTRVVESLQDLSP
ncbi:unnamed protein product [Albugo candida]|uniref:Uncharacterized protein n=1 Tax=Albugo candida TaxID=65357 RepID=A0A024G8Y7_9STRA|nr:unnamed protein product [Albugo candida]|eukprot:CCI43134.1 unnamed protein product [Albugo candida]